MEKKWIFILIGNALVLRMVYNAQSVNNASENKAWERGLPSMPRMESFSEFDKITQEVYSHDICKKDDNKSGRIQRELDLDKWREHNTGGGLHDLDRKMLAKYYSRANAVFEWGLGESTAMAGYFNVTRYAGVDSDAKWVSDARDKCPTHFRLSFADIGRTHNYGRPVQKLQKNQYDYVVAPLISEQCPFDVYLVDGRFRVACGLMALLHASKHWHDTTILMHDFTSPNQAHESYKEILRVCNKVDFSGNSLVALKRMGNVTDEMIHEMYLEFGSNSA
ncbi:hypothetical protein HJC23_012932 [Cyclotella cryptica]|uniref:Methyltransferase n=1 Tax=Cyclotella cryptica TaxID=29204 RepID=A0ABD3Q1Z0_9STRA|eukprot:CCRYP_009295-RA/>CCRYP_009295-RA protein AED:0.29 eAED:0.29 QI:307/1/1/1/1/1/2/375/277